MDDAAWKWIMYRARHQAVMYNQRSKVRAIRLTDRAARRRGSRWYYVIDAPKGGW